MNILNLFRKKRKPKLRLRSVEKIIHLDNDPDISYLEQEGFEDRLKAYNNSQFGFVGLLVNATFAIQLSENTWKIDTISTGGLWGIESDSQDEYLEEVWREEYEEMMNMLDIIGIDRCDHKYEDCTTNDCWL